MTIVVELLVAVGVTCGLTGVLALLIVIANATIANYGEVTVTINDEKKLEVQGGRPLLGTLKEEKLFIPSACGGRGSCGLCKVKITGGAGDYLSTELPFISPEEKKENIRLSCQIKVKQDMAITVPEKLFKVKQFLAEVVELKDLTYDIKEVTLKLLEPTGISFKAGQFIQFEVPEYELTDEPVYRAYSIASQPSMKDSLQLEIRLVPNGICTTYVHKYLKTGDRLTINGPYGDFYLRDTDRDIIFMAGGSGMAPIRSILFHMAENRINRRAHYFFGARARKDLFLVDEMREFEKKLPNFTFVPALSCPDADDRWEGEMGRNTAVFDRMIEFCPEAEAYLCGSPGMVAACVDVLTAKGVPEERIYYDKFA